MPECDVFAEEHTPEH